MFKHSKIPSYMVESQLEQPTGCAVQIMGELSARGKGQGMDMFANGFWHDASRYLLLTKGCRTVAWLGFGRHSNPGIIMVRQIQGRQRCIDMPKDWVTILLASLIHLVDKNQIKQINILPARLSTYWKPALDVDNIVAHRGRLITYYDRIPKRLGFNLVSVQKQKEFCLAEDLLLREKHSYRPYHTLDLKR